MCIYVYRCTCVDTLTFTIINKAGKINSRKEFNGWNETNHSKKNFLMFLNSTLLFLQSVRLSSIKTIIISLSFLFVKMIIKEIRISIPDFATIKQQSSFYFFFKRSLVGYWFILLTNRCHIFCLSSSTSSSSILYDSSVRLSLDLLNLLLFSWSC